MKMCVQAFVWTHVLLSHGWIPRNEMSGKLVGVCLTTTQFPKYLYDFTFPSAVYYNSNSFVSWTTIGMVSSFNFNYSNRYIISHCRFNCISLVTIDVNHLLTCLFTICVSFLICLLKYFLCVLKIELFPYCWILRVINSDAIVIDVIWKYFLITCALFWSSLDSVL